MWNHQERGKKCNYKEKYVRKWNSGPYGLPISSFELSQSLCTVTGDQEHKDRDANGVIASLVELVNSRHPGENDRTTWLCQDLLDIFSSPSDKQPDSHVHIKPCPRAPGSVLSSVRKPGFLVGVVGILSKCLSQATRKVWGTSICDSQAKPLMLPISKLLSNRKCSWLV